MTEEERARAERTIRRLLRAQITDPDVFASAERAIPGIAAGACWYRAGNLGTSRLAVRGIPQFDRRARRYAEALAGAIRHLETVMGRPGSFPFVALFSETEEHTRGAGAGSPGLTLPAYPPGLTWRRLRGDLAAIRSRAERIGAYARLPNPGDPGAHELATMILHGLLNAGFVRPDGAGPRKLRLSRGPGNAFALALSAALEVGGRAGHGDVSRLTASALRRLARQPGTEPRHA